MGCLSSKLEAISAPGKSSGFSVAQITDALREALKEATNWAVAKTSAPGGIANDPRLRIPWPAKLQNVANKLRSAGLSGQVDKFEATMNKAAEEATKGAAAIFCQAIMAMNIEDAKGILNGGERAATDYLQRTTSPALSASMTPVVHSALESNRVTALWDDLIRAYNAIPLVPDVHFDLPDYIVGKANDALFLLIGEKEQGIRAAPAEAASKLVQGVFSWKQSGLSQ
eukprot:GGOE01000744.1.p1 GENE.GGOE01000744.1~~GGOE01000744.1.p1  ORF type:complete len:227 (-),score=66.42 GGOE01000744.1:290-970(-)